MKKKWDVEPRYGWHRLWSWVSFRAFIIANVRNPEADQILKKRTVPPGPMPPCPCPPWRTQKEWDQYLAEV